MKPSTSNNPLSHSRRTLFASCMVLLLGTGTVLAQAGSSGSATGGTGSTSTSSDDTSTSGRQSGSSTYGTGGTRSTTDPRTDSSSTRSTTAGTVGATGQQDKLSWGERRFLSKTAEYDHDEKELAKLAAERASNPEVRSYAQKLVQEHEKMSSELMSLANQKNVEVDLDDDKSRAYNRLSKMSGTEFDQEFVEHMIDQHERDVERFEEAAEDSKDPQVRQFASKHVSSLREHLQQAQNLRQTIMPTGRTDDSSGRSTSGATSGTGYGTSSTDSTSTGTTGTTGTRSGTDYQRDSSTGASSDTSSSGSTRDSSTTDRNR